MDFVELETVEGLRWSWNSWPKTKGEATSLVIPLSIMHTPLMEIADLPVLSYEPLICKRCSAVLNPYARVDFHIRLWVCPFCYQNNPFPGSYAGKALPDLRYSRVSSQSGETQLEKWALFVFFVIIVLLALHWRRGEFRGSCPTFVFVLDTAMAEDEFQVLKKEILHVVAQLPDSCLVRLVSFASMVHVHDVSDDDC